MNYVFHPSARVELLESYEYYEGCQPGLGQEFLKEVYSTIQRGIKFPEAWIQFSKNTKRCLTHRFPFGIVYTVLENEIQIIAVMHLKRKPGYWQDRLE